MYLDDGNYTALKKKTTQNSRECPEMWRIFTLHCKVGEMIKCSRVSQHCKNNVTECVNTDIIKWDLRFFPYFLNGSSLCKDMLFLSASKKVLLLPKLPFSETHLSLQCSGMGVGGGGSGIG